MEAVLPSPERAKYPQLLPAARRELETFRVYSVILWCANGIVNPTQPMLISSSGQIMFFLSGDHTSKAATQVALSAIHTELTGKVRQVEDAVRNTQLLLYRSGDDPTLRNMRALDMGTLMQTYRGSDPKAILNYLDQLQKSEDDRTSESFSRYFNAEGIEVHANQ